MSAPTSSPETLELRALQQRERIHRTAIELVSKVKQTREELTPSYAVRRHFGAASLMAATLSLILGYAVGNALTR
jgi:hypothetical protein